MVNVTQVVLPDRTRMRLEAESNQQRAQKPHDLRTAIPLVDYTNPARFPPYVFREYPKMPLVDDNQPVVIDDSGGVLVFYTAEDEAEFLELNPELAETITRNAPEKAFADRIAQQASEIEDLRAKLRSAGVEDKPRNKLAGAAAPDSEGLRSRLPPGNGNGNPLKKS